MGPGWKLGMMWLHVEEDKVESGAQDASNREDVGSRWDVWSLSRTCMMLGRL